jgi:hypothetical protein
MSEPKQPLLKADTSEEPIVLDPEAEKKEILKRYRAILRACKATMDKGRSEDDSKSF